MNHLCRTTTMLLDTSIPTTLSGGTRRHRSVGAGCFLVTLLLPSALMKESGGGIPSASCCRGPSCYWQGVWRHFSQHSVVIICLFSMQRRYSRISILPPKKRKS